jgi:hypothetical protein
MDAMPVKRLIEGELEYDGEVCTLGVITRARGIDTSKLKFNDGDDEYYVIGRLKKELNIAECMVRELMWVNDDAYDSYYFSMLAETPEARWVRVRKWVAREIRI